MEINYKKNKHKEVARVGDLIKLDNGVIGLVLIDEEIALLKFTSGIDWFELANVYKKYFKKGKYEIIAKAKDWEINIKWFAKSVKINLNTTKEFLMIMILLFAMNVRGLGNESNTKTEIRRSI